MIIDRKRREIRPKLNKEQKREYARAKMESETKNALSDKKSVASAALKFEQHVQRDRAALGLK